MSPPLGTTARLTVHHPDEGDGDEVTAAVVASRDLHHPWVAPPTSAPAWGTYLARLELPQHHGFVLRLAATGGPVGVVNVSDVILGGFRSAHLGYWGLCPHVGQGLVAEGVDWVVDHAFGALGLHRLEANIQPGNAPSLALARRCGFRREGFSPRYLLVDGDWRDHERWAVTAEDRDPRDGGADS